MRHILGSAAHFTTRLLPPNPHRPFTPIPIPTYCLDRRLLSRHNPPTFHPSAGYRTSAAWRDSQFRSFCQIHYPEGVDWRRPASYGQNKAGHSCRLISRMSGSQPVCSGEAAASFGGVPHQDPGTGKSSVCSTFRDDADPENQKQVKSPIWIDDHPCHRPPPWR